MTVGKPLTDSESRKFAMSEGESKEVNDAEEVSSQSGGNSCDEPTTQSVTINLHQVAVHDQGHLQSIMSALGVTTLRQKNNEVFKFTELKEGAS